MKTVVLSTSLRKGSINKILANQALMLVKELGHDVTLLELKDFPMPLYSGDIEAEGIPKEVIALDEKIKQADALFIATPEYNGSIPGVLKNAVDWLSRIKPHCIKGRHIFLLSATPGGLAGSRGLWHTRVPFEAIGGYVCPDMFGLGKSHEAFNEQGQIKDEKNRETLKSWIKGFLEFAQNRTDPKK